MYHRIEKETIEQIIKDTDAKTVADVCERAGYPLNMVCGGRGVCGKCSVLIRRENQLETVTACQTEVSAVSEICVENQAFPENAAVLTGGTDIFRLTESDGKNGNSLAGKADCPDIQDGTADIVPKNNLAPTHCGAAIDIGTTTVALYLCDLDSGTDISIQSGLNRQVIHGADVITRIQYAQKDIGSRKEMQRLILDTVRDLLDRACVDAASHYSDVTSEDVREQISRIAVCGNSTMQHLFFGFDPVKLGASPFINVHPNAVICTASELNLPAAADCTVEFMPLIAGFVGADTLAAMLQMKSEKNNYLMIDLGTNGEIVVGNYNRALAASTACGPALEGGNIACGMIAAEGAIDHIRFAGDELDLHVIGSVEPKGICGSGIIDITAELLQAGIIDMTGRMLLREEYEEIFPDSCLAARIREVEEYNAAFFLTEDIYFSQKDIRQIQLAKSSIYSGAITLVNQYFDSASGLNKIDRLFLAGAFGNYIDIDNALSIGLIPPVTRDKIRTVGNAAGIGVKMVLLDPDRMDDVNRILKNTDHVELSESPEFQDSYIREMNFREI